MRSLIVAGFAMLVGVVFTAIVTGVWKIVVSVWTVALTFIACIVVAAPILGTKVLLSRMTRPAWIRLFSRVTSKEGAEFLVTIVSFVGWLSLLLSVLYWFGSPLHEGQFQVSLDTGITFLEGMWQIGYQTTEKWMHICLSILIPWYLAWLGPDSL